MPLLVGPFSSDQFAGAEDVRRAGVGDAFDPNAIRRGELERAARTLLRAMLAGPWLAPPRWGRTLRGRPGARYAAGLVLDVAAAGWIPEPQPNGVAPVVEDPPQVAPDEQAVGELPSWPNGSR